jgi:DNA repair protein RadC
MNAELLKEQYGSIRDARLALAKMQAELVAMEDRREIYTTTEAMVEQFRDAIGYMPEERFVAIFLDMNKKQLGPIVVYDGGSTNKTILYPRNLFRDALARDATNLVICHNHPSGIKEPSSADRQLTRKVEELGASLGIVLLDHIIITQTSHTSFKDIGLL